MDASRGMDVSRNKQNIVNDKLAAGIFNLCDKAKKRSAVMY